MRNRSFLPALLLSGLFLAGLSLDGLCFSSANATSSSMSEPSLDPSPAKPPPELGLVPWERDFAKAIARSKQSARPILLLFQEVPG